MRSVAFRRGYNVGIMNELRRDHWMQPQVAVTLPAIFKLLHNELQSQIRFDLRPRLV